ncbi:unnamed protein product [Rotaria sp. Silwood1]|nr:unnamed protein product [Rotaria sp. Silwood1]
MTMRLKNISDQLFSISSIYQFSLLLPHEVELLHDLNHTFLDYGHIGCIHGDFADQAHLHPQKVALVLENGSLTYVELLFYAQQLANYLIIKCAVQPGQIVCQLIERSFEMVIGMIGIWMSGGIYTPLNLHDPDKQLNAYIQQTDAHFILVHQTTQNQLLSQCLMINVGQVICFHHINAEITTYIDSINVTPEHISHIIFTSDRSGLLKAVQLRHHNFISSVRSNHIHPMDTVLYHTSVNFDIHLLEIVETLIMCGQAILLHPNGNLREPLMTNTMRNMLNFVNERCRFYNYYGCTECTGTVMQYIGESNNDDAEFLPIGRPLPNIRIYLLDEYLQSVIPGVQTGEIIIGGNIS